LLTSSFIVVRHLLSADVPLLPAHRKAVQRWQQVYWTTELRQKHEQ